MKCPRCKKKGEIIERYVAMDNHHYVAFYCWTCEGYYLKKVEMIEG